MRDTRDMDVVRGEEEEEGIGFVLRDVVGGALQEIVGHVFVDPISGFAAGLVTDPGDAVDDGLVVAMAGMVFEEFGIFGAGGIGVVDGLAELNCKRVARSKAEDAMVLDVNG